MTLLLKSKSKKHLKSTTLIAFSYKSESDFETNKHLFSQS